MTSIDKAVPQGANGHLDKSQEDWLRTMPDGWDGKNYVTELRETGMMAEYDDVGRLRHIKVRDEGLLLTKDEAERLMDAHLRMRDLIREMYRCFVATRDEPWMALEKRFVEKVMAELGIEVEPDGNAVV